MLIESTAYRMIISGVLFALLLASAKSDRIRKYFYGNDESDSKETSGTYGDSCSASNNFYCKKPNYQCRYGYCVCNSGFVLNNERECDVCPALGQMCTRECCPDEIVECFNNLCQICYDQSGYNICRQPNNQMVSITQIAMAISLVLAIFATFVLLYKLCQKSDARRINQHRNIFGQPRGQTPGGERGSVGSGTSVSTLQRYIQERLRDAPPRYTRATSRGTAVAPSAPPIPSHAFDNPPAYDQIEGRENPAFMPDVVLIPPPYCQLVDSASSDSSDSKLKEEQDISAGDSITANERINHI